MAEPDPSSRVLDAAERLFLQHGFAGVRLRHVADALGMRTASLYHHAPGGKADLWQRVVTRALERHRAGMCDARDAAPASLEAQLVAMAGWLLSQPTVNVVAVATSDVQAAPGDAAAMADALYHALMVPVADAVRAAQTRGEVRADLSPDLFAGVFVSAVSGLAPAGRAGVLPAEVRTLADDVVRLLLVGARA